MMAWRICTWLGILLGGIADGIYRFNRVMDEFDEIWGGRKMRLRYRMDALESVYLTDVSRLRIDVEALRTSLEQLECEHEPVVVEFMKAAFPGEHPYGYRLKCSKCGKVLRDEALTYEEALEYKLIFASNETITIQEKLDALRAAKDLDRE